MLLAVLARNDAAASTLLCAQLAPLLGAPDQLTPFARLLLLRALRDRFAADVSPLLAALAARVPALLDSRQGRELLLCVVRTRPAWLRLRLEPVLTELSKHAAALALRRSRHQLLRALLLLPDPAALPVARALAGDGTSVLVSGAAMERGSAAAAGALQPLDPLFHPHFHAQRLCAALQRKGLHDSRPDGTGAAAAWARSAWARWLPSSVPPASVSGAASSEAVSADGAGSAESVAGAGSAGLQPSAADEVAAWQQEAAAEREWAEQWLALLHGVHAEPEHHRYAHPAALRADVVALAMRDVGGDAAASTASTYALSTPDDGGAAVRAAVTAHRCLREAQNRVRLAVLNAAPALAAAPAGAELVRWVLDTLALGRAAGPGSLTGGRGGRLTARDAQRLQACELAPGDAVLRAQAAALEGGRCAQEQGRGVAPVFFDRAGTLRSNALPGRLLSLHALGGDEYRLPGVLHELELMGPAHAPSAGTDVQGCLSYRDAMARQLTYYLLEAAETEAAGALVARACTLASADTLRDAAERFARGGWRTKLVLRPHTLPAVRWLLQHAAQCREFSRSSVGAGGAPQDGAALVAAARSEALAPLVRTLCAGVGHLATHSHLRALMGPLLAAADAEQAQELVQVLQGEVRGAPAARAQLLACSRATRLPAALHHAQPAWGALHGRCAGVRAAGGVRHGAAWAGRVLCGAAAAAARAAGAGAAGAAGDAGGAGAACAAGGRSAAPAGRHLAGRGRDGGDAAALCAATRGGGGAAAVGARIRQRRSAPECEASVRELAECT